MKNRCWHIISVLAVALTMLTACDVHELPRVPEKVPFVLRLNYETDLPKWEHERGKRTIKAVQYSGVMRYVIRAYSKNPLLNSTSPYAEEFVFMRNLSDGYNCEFTLSLIPDDYDIQVWSDMMPSYSDTPFYNVDNFRQITVQGDHVGNSDYRDAFRGYSEVSLIADIYDNKMQVKDVAMQRPMAKFELITNDLNEFIVKEVNRLTRGEPTRGPEDPKTRVNLDSYKVVFYYGAYMNEFNMFRDKPVDVAYGISFESKIKQMSDKEASLGFDYVFVNGADASVDVSVGIYSESGEQLSLTNPIEVPLLRSHHTILRGSFLMHQASGGVVIDPSFDHDINIVIPADPDNSSTTID